MAAVDDMASPLLARDPEDPRCSVTVLVDLQTITQSLRGRT